MQETRLEISSYEKGVKNIAPYLQKPWDVIRIIDVALSYWVY